MDHLNLKLSNILANYNIYLYLTSKNNSWFVRYEPNDLLKNGKKYLRTILFDIYNNHYILGWFTYSNYESYLIEELINNCFDDNGKITNKGKKLVDELYDKNKILINKNLSIYNEINKYYGNHIGNIKKTLDYCKTNFQSVII